jgi:uncharacterized 2Fe-2S/4Fe-4S cluster protein (DUF4445 family)
MIDIRGRFVPDACGPRLFDADGLAHFRLVDADETATGDPLVISQADLDSLTRSKAAMFTILETITATVGIPVDAPSAFFIAGTFGSFIRPDSAITIGMLPDIDTRRYRQLGNSSLGGATAVLACAARAADVDAIRERITYVELNVNQDFMNRFSAAKFYPHTDRSRFPSVRPPGRTIVRHSTPNPSGAGP